MKLKRLLILLAALLPLAGAARADSLASIITNVMPAAKVPARSRPSIIIVQCHGLAPGDLGGYGQTNFQTPDLDRLAAAGVRFTAYTGGTDSTATTALLLSGGNADSSAANLAQHLKANGYHTGLIGEWGLPGRPWKQGFDEFVGFLDDAEGQNYYPDYLWRFAPGAIMDQVDNHLSDYEGKEPIYQNTGGKKGRFLPDLLLDAAAAFARGNEPDIANGFRPFFLLVDLPAPRTARTGADVFPVPTQAPFDNETWPAAAKDRAALITRIDAGIGRLSEQLAKLKMTNSVAVFFTASALPEKFADTNLNFLLPPGSFRGTNAALPNLPMIVRLPGKFSGGKTSDVKWTAADVAPTVLELSGLRPATNFTGISIVPLLHNRPGTNTPALPDRPDENRLRGM